MTVRSHIAPIRFGYGLRQGETPPEDPAAWLAAQLDSPAAPPTGPSSAEILRARAAFVQERRQRDRAAAQAARENAQAQAARENAPAPAQAARENAGPPAARAESPAPTPAPPDAGAAFQEMQRAESRAWAERRLASGETFRDRLVDFWANHFTVSRRNGVAGSLIGALEREAIRPNLAGRFADLAVAAVRHPAMLVYLDNQGSVGPNSPAGQRSRRGLNENLAREVLELHTLSPAGGYTQGDVQEFAKILTGWSVAVEQEPFGFVWRPGTHEPGEKMLLGRRFEAGPDSQEQAIRFLATHPATYRHIAVKLARHFVADSPPPGAVRAIEQALSGSDGSLAAAYKALIALPEAWDPPLTKLRPPTDYLLAAARAGGFDRADIVLGGLGQLAQPLWGAPQPNGWADQADQWASPEALMRRVDWAYTFAGRLGRADPAVVVETALGPFAKAETVDAMRRAGSVRESLTILFASPEFMHR
ncbi:DUF1800 domain-containing protein [Falsiroseomonas sp. HW251]|uniref:DUF1800 domain-containing protein n=1 Tax=Falsiroseomonas sp. HW251 TaxID=3390998 RepID=UPI003D31ADE2